MQNDTIYTKEVEETDSDTGSPNTIDTDLDPEWDRSILTKIPMSINNWKRRVLCRGCVYKRDCCVYEGLKGPIVQCDWFKQDPKVSDKVFEATLLEGLCATCSIRDACPYREQDKDIWHCDKYCCAIESKNRLLSIQRIFRKLFKIIVFWR